MKASDISDEQFIAAIEKIVHERDDENWTAALTYDLVEELEAPVKVVLAKARRLLKRGLIDGCACGCRGDFTVIK